MSNNTVLIFSFSKDNIFKNFLLIIAYNLIKD